MGMFTRKNGDESGDGQVDLADALGEELPPPPAPPPPPPGPARRAEDHTPPPPVADGPPQYAQALDAIPLMETDEAYQPPTPESYGAIDLSTPAFDADPAAPALPEIPDEPVRPFGTEIPLTPGEVDGRVDEAEAARELAGLGVDLSDAPAPPPPPPRRRLATEAPTRGDGSSVRIDAPKLLELLGLPPDASYDEISAARADFAARHDPDDEPDPDAADLKARIRREVNIAYATYRLSVVD